MDLILLRHGKAEDRHPEGDFARVLNGKGRDQSVNAARLLKGVNRLPAIVLTSPYARARQTAEVFCETAEMPGPLVQGWLACGMSADAAHSELAGFREFPTVMIVGHEPDFSMFAADVLGMAGVSLEIRKGALVGLRIEPPSRRGSLLFLVPPKLAGYR